MKLAKSGTKIAVIHGTKEDTPDESNQMKILDIEWSFKSFMGIPFEYNFWVFNNTWQMQKIKID